MFVSTRFTLVVIPLLYYVAWQGKYAPAAGLQTEQSSPPLATTPSSPPAPQA